MQPHRWNRPRRRTLIASMLTDYRRSQRNGRFMKFKVVNFRADRISGWCQAPNDEAGKARIDLLLGGDVVDSYLARTFRPELPAHNFADRNLGFMGSLPPPYWDGQSYRTTLRDRKSTRLNSSHVAISYAVLCLKIKY